jgi:hypothetical protein
MVHVKLPAAETGFRLKTEYSVSLRCKDIKDGCYYYSNFEFDEN